MPSFLSIKQSYGPISRGLCHSRVVSYCIFFVLQRFAGRLRDCTVVELKVTQANIIGHSAVHFCCLEIQLYTSCGYQLQL